MGTSAHPEAGKPEEQHHNAQNAHTFFACMELAALKVMGIKSLP
jgi:hypothetical protein